MRDLSDVSQKTKSATRSAIRREFDRGNCGAQPSRYLLRSHSFNLFTAINYSTAEAILNHGGQWRDLVENLAYGLTDRAVINSEKGPAGTVDDHRVSGAVEGDER